MKTIAIANQKGGVGKTTTTMSLGAALAQLGKQVLLIDLDPQGNLSEYLGWEPDGLPTIGELLVGAATGQAVLVADAIRSSEAEGLDYIPATLSLSNAELSLFSAIGRERILSQVLEVPALAGYDYALIDCLPSLGFFTLNAFAAADSVLIPVQAQKFALDGIEQIMQVLNLVQAKINPELHLEGIVVTMQDKTNMSRAVTDGLLMQYGNIVYDTCIPRSVEAANSTYRQQSLVSYRNKLGDAYGQLAAEVLGRQAHGQRFS